MSSGYESSGRLIVSREMCERLHSNELKMDPSRRWVPQWAASQECTVGGPYPRSAWVPVPNSERSFKEAYLPATTSKSCYLFWSAYFAVQRFGRKWAFRIVRAFIKGKKRGPA